MPNGITFTVGSGVADSAFGLIQGPIQMIIKQEAEAFQAQSMLDMLFRHVSSTHSQEVYSAMTSMEGPRPVAENGAYPSTSFQETFRLTLQNVTWKNQFSISAEALEDDQNLDLQSQPAQFVEAHHRTREEFGAALYANAMLQKKSFNFGGMAFNCGAADGKALFAVDHPSIIKGKTAQCNMFANDFSNEALIAMETKMQHFTDDNGKILHIRPDTILIPNDNVLKQKVLSAIGADKDPNTNNNGFNMNYGRWNVIGWTYLDEILAKTGVTPWVVLDSNRIKRGRCAIWQQRKKMEIKSILDEKNDANVWHDRSRFNAGFGDWRFAAIGGIEGGQELKLA